LTGLLAVGRPTSVTIHRSAQGFDTAADAYERGRPGYPDEAVLWLTDALGLRPGRDVLDLAAGTGKLTARLLDTGAHVVAVEPVEGMRRWLSRLLPEDDIHAGTAEELPFADESLDAVTVAQAFHWFDGERALAEIHRVTRPESRLAVIYNRRPLDHPLQASLESILVQYRGDTPAERSGRWREAFVSSQLWAPRDRCEVTHSTRQSEADVLARVASISFIASLPHEIRQRALDQVRELLSAHDQPVDLPYVCELLVWDRCSADAPPGA
jgi:SAM-dependent methyltransferase